LQCISEMSFSIESKYLKSSMFSMRISEDDEKWVWNIIFILFCIVVAMLKHSDLIRRRIVAWVSVSAIAFLIHFAVLNSFLENCSTFRMISWYSLRFCFLMILLFLSHAWMYSVQSLMIQQFIENMFYTLHATYIKHDFYADFSLRLKRLLRENFLWQIHSSRWTRSFTAQISTVYFLSMNYKCFICDMHIYRSQFLL